jgi:KDO2-lipid IV(A) lauroyltransferase
VARSRLRNGAEYAAALAVVYSLEWLPGKVAERLAKAYAGLLDRAMPRLRRIALRNLSFAMPHLAEAERERLVDEVFHSIGRMLLAFARFPRINAQNVHQWIRYEGYEHYEEALRKGRCSPRPCTWSCGRSTIR